jgi:hypothetical protein
MRFAQKSAGENSEFWVFNVDPQLRTALETLVWEPRDGGWVKSFPRPVPEQAARAFANIQDLLEPLLYQCLGMTAVPWQAALEEVCRRLLGGGVDWWLCGSAALAVRGAAVIPRDLDRVVADADAVAVGELLADGLIEPVCRAGWSISNWWGRAFVHARVEWVGGVTAAADEPQVTDYGPTAADNLQTVRWRDWEIRVPPLHLQRAVSLRRGMPDRVAIIDTHLVAK